MQKKNLLKPVNLKVEK